jgi:hypothetical protein
MTDWHHPILRSSDIELLVALEKRLALARDLYRPRPAPVDWDAYPVEPHLVQLPPPGESVDGVGAFTRDHALPSLLRERVPFLAAAAAETGSSPDGP